MALPPEGASGLAGHYAPKREITFSLKTGSYPEAVERARKEAVRLDGEWARIRALAVARPLEVIAGTEVERLAQAYILAHFMRSAADGWAGNSSAALSG